MAIGDAMVDGFAVEEVFGKDGNAVMVCDVEVMEEDALLSLAIAAHKALESCCLKSFGGKI